ncbi:TetR/AcrR family transcriptional regulator [Spirochaetota bacterium]
MANIEKTLKKKKHIVEALKRLLETNVYSQISIEDVAEEADLSKGGLRHYFPTKEELYTGLIEDFFGQIEKDHSGALEGLENEDKVFVSTLFNIERFLNDKRNIRVFMNLILYGFEDEKIMHIIRKFTRNQLNQFIMRLKDSSGNNLRQTESDNQFKARITQIILLCAGIFETIDPIEMETPRLIRHLLSLSKNKI